MASAALKTRYTAEQYLSLERTSSTKCEYLDGFITAMAGASRAHNRIAGNDRVLVERFTRHGDDWLYSAYDSLDASLKLESIGCAIPLREIYAGVEFPETDTNQPQA
jgi:Putative restriction endonuclease